ncbi:MULTISPECIES: EamA family transporter [Idiomarinaceae]|uniref:EamA family transporter n=1 Tax=Pseudidiomarina fusca TaxID=2965078 RepID=A0ABU3KTS5_9GAMM|nr:MULTISPECIES: EamA family transporter [Idiomarinaceae]MDT7524764.1 EamA family transporter [Pseudidiomarina sp. GXY010]MRJ41456.1 EamA family transporter [Idiomarina sp. FeN1]NCU56931.1 EamA family transporter [Idiomarina sp. FenA--70]NCU59640.1 EamA family transporter [Idiomarina sp. FenBw--71]UUN14290.1 EamA family transporter [Idiomarina loihiensis]
MWILWAVTLLWAASFSLIGEFLAGQVDGYIAVFIRMVLAFLLFIPLWRPRRINLVKQCQLAAIGALQIGVMYLFLYHAFLYLSVPEVLLFTIFTPLYITLLDELLYQRRRLPLRWWLATAIAVVGAAIIRFDDLSDSFWYGFLLIQAANLCFAAGQVFYKRLELGDERNQLHLFALFFFGATLVTGLAMLSFANFQLIPQQPLQWFILAWLGLVASGLGYWAWNIAAKRVNVAQLATMNNMLIPAGLLINYLFWQQAVVWPRLIIGAAVLALAVWLASSPRPTPSN